MHGIQLTLTILCATVLCAATTVFSSGVRSDSSQNDDMLNIVLGESPQNAHDTPTAADMLKVVLGAPARDTLDRIDGRWCAQNCDR